MCRQSETERGDQYGGRGGDHNYCDIVTNVEHIMSIITTDFSENKHTTKTYLIILLCNKLISSSCIPGGDPIHRH